MRTNPYWSIYPDFIPRDTPTAEVTTSGYLTYTDDRDERMVQLEERIKDLEEMLEFLEEKTGYEVVESVRFSVRKKK